MRVGAVLIAGPTASGKSAAALALAERVGGALINADSMQVYREAHILTARPGESEVSRAKHLLFGHVRVFERYSVARFVEDAARALEQVQVLGLLPIFVGGTGLYFGALTSGIAQMPRVSPKLRLAAKAERDRLGATAFFVELARRDPRTTVKLRASDTQRTLRAWEVLEATGRPLADWQTAPAPALLADFKLARFVLSPPREELHRRIEARFDAMVEAGALEEAVHLAGIDPVLPSAKILGRRELLGAVAGEISLDEAKTRAKAATRQYAKRQLTWFRHRMTDWLWLEDLAFSNIIATMINEIS
jgi:tRNA dimethylallyltransferase